MKLLIGAALQPPALDRHELSDSSSVDHAMPVLSGEREHRFVRFFDSSAVLPHRLLVRGKNRPRRILDQNGGVLAAVMTHAGILPGGDAAGDLGDLRIGVHINEIKTGFAAPAATGCRLGAGHAVRVIDPLTLCAADQLPQMRRMAASERKYFSGTSSIKISDNIQPPSLLGDSEMSAVMHAPRRCKLHIPRFRLAAKSSSIPLLLLFPKSLATFRDL